MAGSQLIRGTLILSVAIFVSKFLGLLFVIPFNALVGPTGVFLYSFAFTPYQIILSISTLGIPLAVSKFVSKYNALGDYQTGRKLFKSGLVVMTITGLLGFLILFIFAPAIASLSLSGGEDMRGNNFSDVVLVIRVVSMALAIVPAMSLIRGYFQGFQSMGPTALSQVVEQIARVAFILIGSFAVIKVFDGTPTTAAALATFGAFVGAVAGFYVLGRYWIKRKRHLDEMVAGSTVHHDISLPKMYRELIAYAIPFVAVGIAIPLYQAVDQSTLIYFLSTFHEEFSKKDIVNITASLFMNDQKLVMIPVSLATALALSVVPSLTASFSEGNKADLHRKITQALQFVLFLTIPAAAGLSILGYMVFGMLYNVDTDLMIGGHILRWYAPTALLFALFSVTASILQGIDRQKVTILSLLVGLLLKLILNPITIILFDMKGPIIATDIGFIVSIAINLIAMKKQTGYRFGFIAKRFLLILIFTAVMLIVVKLVLMISGGSIPKSIWHAIIVSILSVVVGGGVYGFLSLRSGLLKQVLGKRIPFLNRFMK
ncbi:O-antigen/teichoic acid export membrane protein [Scopulibacillus darangshiensis]|uniref:O-antigen/teichoic acid export membrane protein n=1 Tax=Scopulibacillus darangshiensis TaxID=442528 RepID=A0A4R2NX90_9BACL|nr:polysaccharide biosynthesis protein [Scopulibacillus darangshiensis]TCP26647.1 O-antigen/teichoic acid export membrane protein [Scopulibacillus darangshiensis]